MKTMCPPGYHLNGSVATHSLVPKQMSCHKAIVVIIGRAHCFITPVLLRQDLSTGFAYLCIYLYICVNIYAYT